MAVVAAAGIAYAQATPPARTPHELDVASFVYVWESIRDTHWQKAPGGLDWQEIRKETKQMFRFNIDPIDYKTMTQS